jgi:hypothetical protein
MRVRVITEVVTEVHWLLLLLLCCLLLLLLLLLLTVYWDKL